MSDIDIRLLDPDDTAMVDAWFACNVEAFAFDRPDDAPSSRYEDGVGLTDHWPGQEKETWVAVADDTITGYAAMDWSVLENPRNAWIEGTVHPAYRRRGIGRALWNHCVARAVAMGRPLVGSNACRPVEGGAAREEHGLRFLEAMGLSPKLTEVRRRVDLHAVDDASLDDLLATSWAKADGYELHRWVNHAPDELVDGLAYLDGRLLQDAPLGDLELEAPKVDAARFRASEERLDKRRRTRMHVALVHSATGTVAAWSVLGFGLHSPAHGFQGITIVDPEHRGHRLGTVAKIELHRYARAVAPRLRFVDTWNAETNSYMIDINEQIGYRVVDSSVDYQGEAAA